MAAEIQDYEPEKLTAGVTWKWEKTLSDYPPSNGLRSIIAELVYELKRRPE